jgi:phosphate starvation-inducible PhoH-like protein
MQAEELLDLFKKEITTTYRGKPIRVKTIGQRHYVKTIRKRDIVFGIGPAGTGKTYLAVVLAVAALKEGSVKRIVLTRPAVEAGENLGFLPGDLQEKVDPYLRPLYDALHDVLGPDQTAKALERGMIEIAPLAYMRGRTLDDAFIILDEAQNTTPEQMKMFLTRLGFGSKMVITGDVTQIDLPRGKNSGLIEAQRILKDIEEIGMIFFSEQDVVRHSLVQKIIVAYNWDAENKA